MAIAEAYLASFRPVAPVPGFDDVLSTAGMNALASIPADNAKIAAQLAAATLGEVGATERVQRNLDAIRSENDLTRRTDRRLAGARMASQLLQSAFPMEGAAGVEVGDPLALLAKLRNHSFAERNKRASDLLRSSTYAEEVLKRLG
jgi:hypothetical protein